MFSAAVNSPSRLGSWNTMPKARRTESGSLTGSWPAIESRPSLGLSTVVSILIVVVLPAPLGPRKPKMTPSGTANEMRSTAVKPSKRLTRSRASMIAANIGSLSAAAPVFEFHRHKAGDRNGEIEWPDHRLQIGEAARKRIERHDVAVAGRGQCREAEIKHRGEFTRAGRCGWEIGKSAGAKLPY